MEIVASDIDFVHFGIRDLDAGRVGVGVDLGVYLQPGFCRGCGYRLDDGLVADERSASSANGEVRLAIQRR